VRFNGKDYVVILHDYRRSAAGLNEIGRKVLDFVRRSPVDGEFGRLVDSLLSEYDAERSLLEEDVRVFVQQCIDGGIFTEPGRHKILGLDLSITSRCNAACVYCPTPRSRPAKRLLGLDEVGKLIDDLRSPAFRAEFGVLSTIEIGGLTEPLLHRRAIEILREFKERYPTPYVMLYTNAVLLTPQLSSALLREELITSLFVSIDGMSQREHFAAKGVPYATVERNVEGFLRVRDELASPCRLVIHVLPYARYRALVRERLNRDPLLSVPDAAGLGDNTEQIISSWSARLGETDEVRDAADRFQLRGEYRLASATFAVPEERLRCPWPDYVAGSLSVSSNGDVLICCNDFLKENVLGNYLATSLYEIAIGPRRRFIEKLIRNDLHELPSRCRQRKYCQPLSFGTVGENHDLRG